MKRVGIFAGTFDPVHDGHLAFARTALEAGLEKVWFLVEPRPRRKQGVRALEHRRAMVDLAIASEPRFGQVILEQARFTPNETLPLLQARFKNYQLVLLFGDDILSHIAHWPHVQELAASVGLLIATRHYEKAELIDRLKTLETTRQLRFNYEFVHPARVMINSSTIRLRLKKRQSVEGLSREVLAYIHRQRLYVSARGGSVAGTDSI